MKRRVARSAALLGVLGLVAWLGWLLIQPPVEISGPRTLDDVPSAATRDAREGVSTDADRTPTGLVGTALREEERAANSPQGARTRWIEVHDGKQPIPSAIIRWSQFERDGVPQQALGTTGNDGIARVRLKRYVRRVHVSARGFLSAERTLFEAAPRTRIRLWRAPKHGTLVVSDSEGLPVLRAQVVLRSTEALVNEIGRTDKLGRVDLPLPAFGSCVVTIRFAGMLPQVHPFDASLVRDGVTFPITLTRIPTTQAQVIDMNTDDSIAGVQISDGVTETTSDHEGRFTFESAFPTFLLHHDDFRPARGKAEARVIRMARKSTSSAHAATPEPHEGLQGAVTLPNGEPAVGVLVAGGHGSVTHTDSEGHYRLDMNHWKLRLDRGIWRLVILGTMQSTTDVRLPGTARLQGQLRFPEGVAPHAAYVRFDAGSGPELTAATPSLGTVSQHRSHSGGGTTSVESPKVRVLATIDPLTTDATGHFEMDEIPVGSYTLYATPDPASDLIPAKVRFVVAHDGTHVDVPLAFGRVFVVRVIDHHDAPVSGALVWISQNEKSAYTDAKGEVRFTGIDESVFNLHVSSAWGTLHRAVAPKRDAYEVVMQLDARPTFTIALTRAKIRNGTQCRIQISEVGGRMVPHVYGRVRKGTIEGRLPSLDLSKQYEVGLKSKSHWSPWAPLTVAEDGSKAHATVTVYRMDEEEEDAK